MDEPALDNSENEGDRSGDKDDNGDEEDDEADAEIVERTTEMNDMAQLLRVLTDVVDYNAQYADPRALAFLTQKTKSAMKLTKKIQKEEKLTQSHTSSHIPAFDRVHSELMFIRTCPRPIGARV